MYSLLLLPFIYTLSYKLNKNKSDLTIGKSVLDKQLITGFIEIQEENFNKNIEQKYIYDLLIFNEEKTEIFYLKKNNIKINEKLSFSFTTPEKQNITIKLLYKNIINNKKSKSNKFFPHVGNVKIEINSNYDFFNQKVIDKEFNNPVSRLMMNYMGVLEVSARKYYQMDKEIEDSIQSFKFVFALVFGFAICIFFAFLISNIMQVKSIRDHFKQKKLI